MAQPLSRHLVLGVTGSVAAYRAADLARELMRRGFVVRATLTDGAKNFVTTDLFAALTGQPCLESAFDEPEPGRMAHIDWARQAEAVVIAPATANLLAKIAAGIADDMLTTILTVFEGPVFVAPAMNPSMFASEANQSALRTLRDRGVIILEPETGDVACGEFGQGKLATVTRIAESVEAHLVRSDQWRGKKVLITSGPTQEPIDMVRYVSNRSSGKMGSALARAALQLGAEVTVVSGPVRVAYPAGVRVISVRTAEEMLAAALPFARESDCIIGAAAVADYRPADPSQGKIRRTNEPLTMTLLPNPDIIATLARVAKSGAVVVGFAAEPSLDPQVAQEKMMRKGLAAIALNNVSEPGIGFESDDNSLTILWPDGATQSSARESKLRCALWFFEQLSARLEKTGFNRNQS